MKRIVPFAILSVFLIAVGCSGEGDNPDSNPDSGPDPVGEDWDDAVVTSDGWVLLDMPSAWSIDKIVEPTDVDEGDQHIHLTHATDNATLKIVVNAIADFTREADPVHRFELGRINGGRLEITIDLMGGTNVYKTGAFYRPPSSEKSLQLILTRNALIEYEDGLESDFHDLIDNIRVAY